MTMNHIQTIRALSNTVTGLDLAIITATLAHAGQTDKGGNPYILHPLHIMGQMISTTARITAVLHDVVEDTRDSDDPVTVEFVCAMFGQEIAQNVDTLTRQPSEPYTDYIERIDRDGDATVTAIKYADLKHNSDLNRLGRSYTATDLERVEIYADAMRYLTKGKW